jgi:calcineurin-like phosphoesterase family protein
MALWFTADEHFGHGNIIRYTGRPFLSVHTMNVALAATWHASVAEDDDVWVLGDVAMGHLGKSLAFIQGLPGVKHLLVGNHDRMFKDGPRRQDWEARYQAAGFDEIVYGQVEFDLAGHQVTLCHFPYRGDSHATDRYVNERPVDTGGWLLHGHVHERWRQSNRQINVGVDAWAGQPVSADQLVELIVAGPRDLAPLAWS